MSLYTRRIKQNNTVAMAVVEMQLLFITTFPYCCVFLVSVSNSVVVVLVLEVVVVVVVPNLLLLLPSFLLFN